MPRSRKPEPKPPRRPVGTGSVAWVEKRQRWRARLPKQIGEMSARESWHLTKDEAEAWIARELARSVDTFDARRSLGDYLDYWQELHADRLGDQTRVTQCAHARAYAELRTVPLERLRGDQLQAAQARLIARKRSRRYARVVTTLIKRALNDAVRWKILAENVAETVTLPQSEPRKTRAWEMAEIQALLAEIVGHRFEAAYLLILWAGLRIGEVMAIRWSAIDADGIVTVSESEHSRVKGRPIGTTKRERVREVDLPAAVTRRLRELRSASQNVYVTGKSGGGRWSARTVYVDWLKLTTHLKIQPLAPHGGRRSYGTMHMLAGTPLADLAVLMGHASPATTAAAYLGSSRTRRKQAADRLADMLAPPKRTRKGRREGQQGS